MKEIEQSEQVARPEGVTATRSLPFTSNASPRASDYLQKLVLDQSIRFITLHPDEIDKQISESLETIGQSIDAGRTSVYVLSPDGLSVDMTHEWCAKGVPPRKDKMQNRPVSLFAWSAKKLFRGKTVIMSDPRSLPKNAAAEAKQMQLHGVESLVMVPMLCGEVRLGILTASSPRKGHEWPEASVDLLRIFGTVLANAIQRKHRDQQVRATNARLVRHQKALLSLAQAGEQDPSDLNAALHRIAETAAKTLRVDRISIWKFDKDRRSISSIFLYADGEAKTPPGEPLNADDYPNYFTAIEQRRILAADNARTDPRTNEFRESYLEPLGIFSMLDAPIRIGGKIVGLICHEDMGPPRHWTSEDQTFAASIADYVAITLEREELSQNEKALRESQERYALAVQGAKDGLWDWDLRTDEVYFSPRAKAILGYADDEFGNRLSEWRSRVHPNDVSKIETAMSAHLDGKTEHYECEHRVRHKDGRYLWMFDRGVCLRTAEGEAYRIAGSITDITIRKQVEQDRLRVSNERYYTLAEILPVGIAVLNPKGEIIYANAAATKNTDLGRQNLEDLRHDAKEWDLLDANGNPVLPEDTPFSKVMRTGEPVNNQEVSIAHAKRGRVLLSINASPIRNAEGEIESVVSVATDITDRRRDEEQRAETSRFLEAIIENIPDMIFVKHAKDLSFARFNRAGEELLGMSREELLGKSDHDFFPREEAEFFNKKDREVLESGKLIDIPEEPIETRKGKRLLHTKKIPISDSEGNPTYLLGISEDITDRKRIEKDIRLLARITALSAEGIFSMDEKCCVTFWNEASEKIFGFTASEMLGRDFREVLVPKELRRDVNELIGLGPDGEPRTLVGIQTERLHKNGRRIPVMVTTFPLSDEYGMTYGRAGIIHDLTEIREMEQELLRQSRMAAIGTMAAGIAHEIRNPLFGISTVAQILRRQVSPDSETRELADSMLSEIKRLEELLENLLLYARPKRLEYSEVRPKEICEMLLSLHKQMLQKRGIQLETNFEPEDAQVKVDSSQIQQVLLNLCMNAAQSSPANGKITVKSRIIAAPNSTWVFEMHNHGKPISKKNLNKIFDPFFSTQKGGLGLGLSICRKIVEEHGGSISCVSNRKEGTTFTFRLPTTPA